MCSKISFSIFAVLLLLCTAVQADVPEVKVVFTPGWDRSQWLTVKSPRWKTSSKWKQESDRISNVIPGEPGSDYSRPVPGGDYISMLYKQPVTGSARVEMTSSSADGLAPLLVISPELTPVYREHIEVVVFKNGINVWHHFWKNNKPSWKLIFFHSFSLESGKKHKLVAELRFNWRGAFLCIGIDSPEAAILLPSYWPKTNYFGITACEGRNSFYDFMITRVSKSSPAHSRLPIK